MQNQFSHIIETESELREILGEPSQIVLEKATTNIDEHCQDFIDKSPFLLIATADSSGNMDVSPKGDPAGFVQVLDNQTLAIPDRVGNRRADTFRNLLQNDHVALLFIIPDKSETLRVSGRAKIVRDQWLRDKMMVKNKVPDFAIVVSVEEAFFHCAKCMVRAHMWDVDSWQNNDDMATLAQILHDHSQVTVDVDALQREVEEEIKSNLY